MDSSAYAFYDPHRIEQVSTQRGWLSLPVSEAQPYAKPNVIEPDGLVFGIADGTITDLSLVRAQLAPSHAWGSSGHPRIGVDKYRLPEPVRIDNVLASLLPYRSETNGDSMRGRLADSAMVTPIPQLLGAAFWRLVRNQAEPVVIALAARQPIASYLNQRALFDILGCRDLSLVKKIQLQHAFEGEGDFRAEVEALLPVCPITREQEGRKLCPIIPWYLLSDGEKGDPNNALLLSDSLIDAFRLGLIYFDEGGHPQASSRCGFTALEGTSFCGPDAFPAWNFTVAQKKYLARHTREISLGQ
ncbi:MAG: hypothetical protein JNM61_13005 [Zoogloeaceae bacterium]|nr:hypothetical protein [Zoogloeaceae bacterium]